MSDHGSGDRPRVLVVDDDPAFASMIAEVLREKGFDAVACLDPTKAAEQCGDGNCAAAVVDLVMPAMGGIEVADGIRAKSPDTQVVILTGHGDLSSAISGIKAGVFDYLQKAEIDISRLTRSVAAATERFRLLRENRRLVGELRESNRLLTMMHSTSASISAEEHVDRLLIDLVSAAKGLCNAESGRTVLFQEASERFVIERAFGDAADSLAAMRMGPQDSITARVFGRGAVELVASPRDDPQFSERIDRLPTERPGLIVAPLRHGRVRGALLVGGRRQGEFGEADRDMLATLARHGAVAADNALVREKSVNFFTHTCDLLVTLLDRLDVYYVGHSRNTARLADMITRRLGLTDADRRNVHFAALLHDIGKLLIPVDLLKATHYRSDEDRLRLRQHPALALELLKPIATWQEILPMIHSHHERWDGNGYPLGVAGEEIPLGGRIVSVAEAFDAMTRQRPHGPPRTPKEALAELEAFAGSQFDPKIVRLFVAEYRHLEGG